METLSNIINNLFNIILCISFFLSSFYLIATATVLIFCRNRKELPAVENDEDLPAVTIQIPTRNELAALNCVKCCLNFDYPKDRVEIIIGDDSDIPEISKEIDAFAKENKVRVSRRSNNIGYKAGNLNTMTQISTGDYLLIFDSDFLPESDFLRKIVRPVVADKALAGVQARWNISNSHQNLTTVFGTGIVDTIHMIMLPFMKYMLDSSFLCGSAMLLKKSSLEAIDGWKNNALTEDVDCTLRLFENNEKIYYLTDTTVKAETPFKVKDLLRQQLRWAYGVTRTCITNIPGIIFKKIGWRKKIAIGIFSGGYLLSGLILLNMIIGPINFILSTLVSPEPWSEYTMSVNINALRNFVFSCGMFASSIFAGFLKGHGLNHLLKLVVASLIIGTPMLLWVGRALLLAMFNIPIKWYAPQKSADKKILEQNLCN